MEVDAHPGAQRKKEKTVSRLLGSWENSDLVLKLLLRFSSPVFIFLKEKEVGGGASNC